jgi:hypothetical protein
MTRKSYRRKIIRKFRGLPPTNKALRHSAHLYFSSDSTQIASFDHLPETRLALLHRNGWSACCRRYHAVLAAADRQDDPRKADAGRLARRQPGAFTGLVLWMVYGVLISSWPVIVANAITLALILAIVVLKLRYG